MANSKLDEMTGGSSVPAVPDNTDAVSMVPRVRYKRTETIDPSSIRPVNIWLAQALTNRVSEGLAKAGQWLAEGYAPYDALTIIPLATQRVRSYRPDRNQAPQCQAPEGDFGYGDPGGPCKDCPLSHWGPKNPATGKGTPPPCDEMIMVRAYSVEHRALVDVSFRNRDIAKGALLAQQAMSYGYGNFGARLSSSKTSNNLGTWYVPDMELVLDLSVLPEEDRELAEKWHAVNDKLLEMEEDAPPF